MSRTMATQTKKKSNRVAKRASESRRATQVMSKPVAEFNGKAAERIVAGIARAQADFTRASTNAYGRAARELVS